VTHLIRNTDKEIGTTFKIDGNGDNRPEMINLAFFFSVVVESSIANKSILQVVNEVFTHVNFLDLRWRRLINNRSRRARLFFDFQNQKS